MEHPSERDKASMIVTIDQAATWARALEDREAGASGLPLPAARDRVASRIKVPAGTLENLRRGRLKEVRATVAAALHAAFRKSLEAEIAKLEHELAILDRTGKSMGAGAVREAEAAIVAARQAVERARQGG
jgi:hypothetical protein